MAIFFIHISIAFIEYHLSSCLC